MKYNVGMLFSDSFGYHSLSAQTMKDVINIEQTGVRSERDRRLLLNLSNICGYLPGFGGLVGFFRLLNGFFRMADWRTREYYKGQILRGVIELLHLSFLVLVICDVVVTKSMMRFRY